MDKILVVSNHARSTYINTKVNAVNRSTGESVPYNLDTPVEVVWESTPRPEPENIPGLNLDYDFNFVMVSQVSPRKNFVNALKWWVEEFIDQEVGLVIKGNIKCNSLSDYIHLEPIVSSILSKYPDRKCKVYLLHGDLSSGQMIGLYTNPRIKAMVNIAHGEGFGLPMFEAAREGLPIVTIGWSGQVDFLMDGENKNFQEVEFSLSPVQPEAVWNGVIEKDSMWASADQGSYKIALRRTFKNYDQAYEKAQEAQEYISKNFNDEKLYEGFVTAIYGEQIDVDAWLKELEDDIVEQE